MAPAGQRAPTLGQLGMQYVGDRLRRGEIGKSTAANMRVHLRSFAASFGNRPVTQLGPRATERWLEQMEAEGIAPSTRRLRLSTVRGFARWCVLNGHAAKDWTLAAPKVRVPRQTARDMTNDHAEAMLDACGSDRRLRAVVWLQFGCGLRCVEVARLRVDDFEPATRSLFVVGKGGHERVQHVPDPVASAIVAYLAEAGHGSGPLIRPADGAARHLSPSRISHLVGELARAAGVKIRPYDGRSAHGLRAAAASDVYDVCHDPRIVQEFLGHADLATIKRYLRRATADAVAEAVDARWSYRAA